MGRRRPFPTANGDGRSSTKNLFTINAACQRPSVAARIIGQRPALAETKWQPEAWAEFVSQQSPATVC